MKSAATTDGDPESTDLYRDESLYEDLYATMNTESWNRGSKMNRGIDEDLHPTREIESWS